MLKKEKYFSLFNLKKIIVAFLVTLIISSTSSCTNNNKDAVQLDAEIKKAELALLKAPNDSLAIEIKKMYLDFVASFPNHADAPLKLFKAADIAREVKQFDEAILLLNKIHESYPKSQINGDAWFALAFIYQNDLNQIDEAERCYNHFIEHFPNHELAPDAQIMLTTLSLSTDELLNQIMKKAK